MAKDGSIVLYITMSRNEETPTFRIEATLADRTDLSSVDDPTVDDRQINITGVADTCSNESESATKGQKTEASQPIIVLYSINPNRFISHICDIKIGPHPQSKGLRDSIETYFETVSKPKWKTTQTALERVTKEALEQHFNGADSQRSSKVTAKLKSFTSGIPGVLKKALSKQIDLDQLRSQTSSGEWWTDEFIVNHPWKTPPPTDGSEIDDDDDDGQRADCTAREISSSTATRAKPATAAYKK